MMKNDEKKLLKLCLSGLEDNNLNEKNFKAFSKDYAKFSKDELTFRELIASVKDPQGELRDAMRAYYDNSQYVRQFKGR